MLNGKERALVFYDVNVSQCTTIFGAAEDYHQEASTARTSAQNALNSLVAAAQDEQLSAALVRLRDNTVLSGMKAAMDRWSTATQAGREAVGHVGQGDEEMNQNSQSGQNRIPAADMPGVR